MRSGILVVDKPAGPTSFDVVKRVRRALGAQKAGHAGTLDPAATGVLVVCVGDAVKLQQFLTDGDKAYEATVAFGAATDTEDAEGRVVARADAGGLSEAALVAALPAFVGTISQVPPMYSAVRVDGRHLYEAARAGEEVARAPRTVRVDVLRLLALEPPADGIRRARLLVRCGKGTYVRTLAADLGRALGLPAHLAALRRIEASGFRVEEALPLDAAEALARDAGRAALDARLVPLADALRGLAAEPLTDVEARDLAHGRRVARPPGEEALVRAILADGRLLAICRTGAGHLAPVRVFLGAADLPAAAGRTVDSPPPIA